MVMMSAQLESLKQSLRQLAPTTNRALQTPAKGNCRATGFAQLDAELEMHGLPFAAVTEIAGAASSGKTALALTACATFTTFANNAPTRLCAFIDGRGEFYPPAAAALGVDLTRLLWARPPSQITAVARATEIVVRSRGFAIVVVDIPRGSRLTRAVAQRLRTSASQTSTSLIVLCDRAGDVEQAQVRLAASRSRGKTSVLIHKGSNNGGTRSVALPLERRRAIAREASPISAAIERTLPGNEPPGARLPKPSVFPKHVSGAI